MLGLLALVGLAQGLLLLPPVIIGRAIDLFANRALARSGSGFWSLSLPSSRALVTPFQACHLTHALQTATFRFPVAGPLARLMTTPALILLDEPTAELDPATAAAVWTAIFAATLGRTLICATHDPAAPATFDLVLRVTDGEVTADPRPPAPGP